MRLSASLASLVVLSPLACLASGFAVPGSPQGSIAVFGNPHAQSRSSLATGPLKVPSWRDSSSSLTRGGGCWQHVPRGGAATTKPLTAKASSSPIDTGSKCPVTGLAAALGSLYGAGGVVYVLAKAIKRVLPIALEPFQAGTAAAVALTNFQLGYVVVL